MPKRKTSKKKSLKKRQTKPRRWPKGRILVGVSLVTLIFIAYSAWQYHIQLPPTIGGETNNPLPNGSAPNFSLSDINGTQFSLDQFSGKVIAIHFMAVGCSGQISPINDHQLKQLKTVCNDYCGNRPVNVITVAVATCPNSDLAGICADYNVTWTLGNDYADGKMDVIDAYEPYLIRDGTILLVDKTFSVDKVYAEATTAETLSSRINHLLEV
jgi:peroxiredoxin